MPEFHGRNLHLVKKALCIAVLTMEMHPHELQSMSDMDDMKRLLDRLFSNDTELAFYMNAARISVTGKPS